jgi:hypothetical protein
MVLRKEADPTGHEPDAAGMDEALRFSTGEALPDALRRQLELVLCADFSSVRVHTDKQAVTASATAGARAFTLGSHIFFGRGEYQPDSAAGVDLLLHELVHVTQWLRGAVPQSRDKRIAGRADPLEPVTRWDGAVSPWMFPVVDERMRARTTDRRGRARPGHGDRRSPETNYFSKCVKRALAAAKIEHRVTVHGLRRTFSALMQDAGAPDSVFGQVMGHAPKGVTERHYLPRRDPVLQAWVDRIQLGPEKSAPYMPPVGDSAPENRQLNPAFILPAPEILQ